MLGSLNSDVGVAIQRKSVSVEETRKRLYWERRERKTANYTEKTLPGGLFIEEVLRQTMADSDSEVFSRPRDDEPVGCSGGGDLTYRPLTSCKNKQSDKNLPLSQSSGHTVDFSQLQYRFNSIFKSQPFKILISKLNIFL